jgi:hypothetical protein
MYRKKFCFTFEKIKFLSYKKVKFSKMSHCKQCEGKTATGKRCRNKVSCDLGCHAYCHLHSKGYEHVNIRCTTPSRRHEYEGMTYSEVYPKRKSPKRGKKKSAGRPRK